MEGLALEMATLETEAVVFHYAHIDHQLKGGVWTQLRDFYGKYLVTPFTHPAPPTVNPPHPLHD